jgi:NTE family protein
MTTAFVFSGGASLGSVQVGMVMALEDAGIEADLITGASVGAVNGAWLASRRSAYDLADVWRGMGRSDLFPLRPLAGLRGFLGHRSHFVSNNGLRRLLERHVGFSLLEESEVPFTVIATDARSGEEVPLTSGPAVRAILASTALPAVFPPIEIDGRVLIDGGVVNNTPITHAIQSGATEVWVLSTGYSCGLAQAPSGAVAMAMHSVALLVQQRLALETARRHYGVPVHLIPPPCPISVTPIDFSQTEQLIERAHAGTSQWLKNGCPNAMPLTFHHLNHELSPS